MSKLFLSINELGDLYIKQVIVQYDYPLLFICEDQFDSLYIVNEVSDSEEYEEWIAAKITRKKYIDILESRISLREAFITDCNIPYLLIKHYYLSGTVICESISDPQDDFFPDDDLYMSTFCGDKRLIEKDSSTDSSILEIEAYPGMSVDGISIGIHNNICSAINGIADGLFGNCIEVKLLVPKTASFSIQFKITSKNKTKIESQKAIEGIAKAINSLDSANAMEDSYKLKVLEQSEKFLSSMAETKKGFVLIYDGETQKKVYQSFSYSETLKQIKVLKDSISIIQEKEKNYVLNTFKVDGKLVAFDIIKGTFSMRYIETIYNKKTHDEKKISRIISGKLNPGFNEGKFVGYESSYEATIEEFEKKEYRLLSLIPQPAFEF